MELLDDPAIPFEDIRLNMRELNIVNTYLGGHNISIKGLITILSAHKKNQPITICEIGCGDGNNLKAVYQWCLKNNIKANLTGIDIKPACIKFAQQQHPALPAEWIRSDYKDVDFRDKKPEIIFSSLFCHHFTNDELVQMLQWMKAGARMGFFINDLHRHWLAYYSIKWITGIFSSSYLVKNDAPVSVTRGFKLKEWKKLFQQAGIPDYSIEWKWAFRHLITYIHERQQTL